MGTFIHTADTHLGYRQYHRPEREKDFMAAFEQVIDTARTRDVDAVIHAGDFFHDSRPSTSTIRAALEQLRRLDEAGIPFLAVVGNHDGTQDAQWVDIFSELGLAVHLGASPTVVNETAIYGLDHVPPARRAQLAPEFEPHDADAALLVMHGLIAPLSPYGTWEATQLLGQSPVSFDAVLLGDDHTPRIERVDDTIFTYAGSTERTAIDQRQDRVVNLVTAGADGVAIEPYSLDTRPHVFIELELAPGEGEDRIRRALDGRDIANAVVAVSIDGDGEDVTPAALEEYGKQQGALVVRVRDRRQFDVDGADIDVSFADPDAAVQKRLREMALSVAAYDVEQTVRDVVGQPKSTVAETIESRIDARIDRALEDFTRPATIEAGDADGSSEDGSPTGPTEPAETASGADESSVSGSPDGGVGAADLEAPEPDESPPEQAKAQLRIEDYQE